MKSTVEDRGAVVTIDLGDSDMNLDDLLTMIHQAIVGVGFADYGELTYNGKVDENS